MPKNTSAQLFVPLKEIRDGIAILKDGSMRVVLLASSINFALKSRDEQEAILMQFQSFLNTLDFSVQIYIQSRRLDIRPYLEILQSRETIQDNDLMRIQLREYIGFITKVTEEADIMTKSFFVVIPYSPSSIDVTKNITGAFDRFRNIGSTKTPKTDTMRFEEHRTQIEQRIGVVTTGLNRVGIRTVVLGTDEVVELFYRLFNPKEEHSAPSLQ